MNLYDLLDEVQRRLRPAPEIREKALAVVIELQKQLDKRDIKAKATLGGSFAKGTHLADSHDIDIYVRFDYSYPTDELSDILAPCLKQFKPDRVHGSRDYFQFVFEDFDFEIIPILHVTDYEQAKNITDMSPLHVEFFRGNGQGLEDQVRLFKQFCKACDVYGAESYKRGFSGHVVDLIIIHFKSFYDAVKAIASWKTPTVIDVAKHHENPLQQINKEKHGPLVLVDPAQPFRNAAAALSQEQFDNLVLAAKEFVKNPSKEAFEIQVFSENELRNDLECAEKPFVFLHASHQEQDRKDVAGAKVRKAFERLLREVQDEGFTITSHDWHFVHHDNSVLWFTTQEFSLPRIKVHQGPFVSQAMNASQFRRQYPDAYEEDGRLFAKVERECTFASQIAEKRSDELFEQLGVRISVVK